MVSSISDKQIIDPIKQQQNVFITATLYFSFPLHFFALIINYFVLEWFCSLSFSSYLTSAFLSHVIFVIMMGFLSIKFSFM